MNIRDLERKTGISARNIRFLTSNGLLPKPSEKGRGATYGQAHLDALTVYRKCKDEGITSLEIISQKIAEREVRDDHLDLVPGVRLTMRNIKINNRERFQAAMEMALSLALETDRKEKQNAE